MKVLLRIAYVAMLLVLAGCETVPTNGSGNYYAPIVDQKSIDDPNLYYSNIADCNLYADRISVGQNAAGGAIIGALLGAAIGVAVGDRGSFARYGATVGAVNGAVSAGAGAAMTKAQIVRNCMAGRGYVVLDGPVTVPIGVTAQIAGPCQQSSQYEKEKCQGYVAECKAANPGIAPSDSTLQDCVERMASQSSSDPSPMSVQIECEKEALHTYTHGLSIKAYAEECVRRKELDSQSRPVDASTPVPAPTAVGVYAKIPCDTVKEEFKARCEADHK